MPLRVAEQEGWLKAVNKCEDCPFMSFQKHGILRDYIYPELLKCLHPDNKDQEMLLVKDRIPVWCPLPRKEYREIKVLEPENKLDIRSDHRHLRREHIVGDDDFPDPITPVFIVEDVEIDGLGMNVTIKPEFPRGPDWTYLRKDDWLRKDDLISYLVLETPTSSRIRITREPKLKKGDRLTALGPARETEE